jgi:hypothetical protein
MLKLPGFSTYSIMAKIGQFTIRRKMLPAVTYLGITISQVSKSSSAFTLGLSCYTVLICTFHPGNRFGASFESPLSIMEVSMFRIMSTILIILSGI